MSFNSFSEFVQMGGHGLFVWTAYGIAIAVLGYNIINPVVMHKRFVKMQKQSHTSANFTTHRGVFIETIKRDLTIAYRNAADLLNPLVFFVIVVSLFPLGIGPSAKILSTIAPGVLWVAALLATLLSIDGLFKGDYDDGSLEQILLSPQPLFLIVVAKVVSHWLVTGFPLTLLSPVLGVMFYLPVEGIWSLVVTLLIGTPLLSLIGSIGAGLTVGLKKGGILISVLILPLYIPVLILGTSAVETTLNGFSNAGQLLWMSALLALGIGLSPLATAASLRVSAAG